MSKKIIFLLLFIRHADPAQAACSVTATNIAFGNFNPFQTSPLSTNGTISITCTAPFTATYSVTLSAGGDGSWSPRHMQSGANLLNYNLYTSAALGTIWGSGVGGTGTGKIGPITTLCSAVTPCTHTVYGQVPAPQATVIPGSYTATITVTLTY